MYLKCTAEKWKLGIGFILVNLRGLCRSLPQSWLPKKLLILRVWFIYLNVNVFWVARIQSISLTILQLMPLQLQRTPRHPGQRKPLLLYQRPTAGTRQPKPHAPSPVMPCRWHLQPVIKTLRRRSSRTCRGRWPKARAMWPSCLFPSAWGGRNAGVG